MDAMELIAFRADPASLPTGMAMPGGDRSGRGPQGAAPFDTFADILAASEAARRRADEPQPRKFDDSGLDDLEEESLRRRHADRLQPPLPDHGAIQVEQPATVTRFLPQEMQPRDPVMALNDNALPGLQDRLMTSTAGAALAASGQGAAAQAPAQAAAMQEALAGMEGRNALRQDSMADGAALRLDKREALIQPAVPAGTAAVPGKSAGNGGLLLVAGQEGGQTGQQAGQGGSQSGFGQNGQSNTAFQAVQAQAQGQADPTMLAARAEQFAGAMAQHGRGTAPGQAAQTTAQMAALDGATQAGSTQAGSTQAGSMQAGSTQAGTVPAPALGQAEQAGRAEGARQPQAPQMARPTLLQPAVEQVAVRIATLAKSGMDMIRIQLEPADLGRVDVRLQMAGGEVTAIVTADRQETLDLLQRDSRSLQQALQDAGLKTSGEGLSFSLRDDGKGAPMERDARNSELAGGEPADRRGEEAAMAAAATPQWRSDRALDILA